LVICAAVALAINYAPSTQAQTFYPPAVSLASLTNSGATLLVGDKLFSHFGITGYNAGSIDVEGIEEYGSDYGIQFSGSIAADDSSMDLTLQYQVTVTNSANLISQANLSFNGVTVGGPGIAEVTEDVYTNMNYLYGQMEVYATQSSQVLSTNMAINPPQAQLNLDKDVLVYSVTLPAFSSISTINQSFVQVPEPSSVALVGMGLMGLLAVYRRRK
jgi:hypothetical protein